MRGPVRIFCLLTGYLIAVALLPPVAAQVPFQFEFPVPGEYIISLPGNVASPTIVTDQDLLSAIPNATAVGRWSPTSFNWHLWDGGTCTGAGPAPGAATCGASCFCVEPSKGEGYRVVVGSAGLFSFSGVDPFWSADMVAGTNVIALPFNTPLQTAHQLLTHINLSAGAIVVASASKQDPFGGLITWTGIGGTNFDLTPGEGYVVNITQPLRYQPPFSAPTLSLLFPFPFPTSYQISLPGNIVAPVITNETELLDAIPNATTVTKPDAMTGLERTWDGTTCSGGLPPEPGCACFCVDPLVGRGFRVSVSGRGMLVMTANDVPTSIDLLSGTNLISLPHGSTLTDADDLFTEINNVAGSPIVAFVSRLDPNTGGLDTWTGFSGTNFQIVPGEAYSVTTTGPLSNYGPTFTYYLAGTFLDWRNGSTQTDLTSNAIPGATADLTGGVVANQLSGPVGEFLFDNLPNGLDYTLTPSFSGSTVGAVDILDALDTATHAVGLSTFTPNQLIAGDVSANCLPVPFQAICVTTYDALLMAQTAAGLGPLPVATITGSEWFFIPIAQQAAVGQVIVGPNQPTVSYTTYIDHGALPHPVSGLRLFTGVWGDVRGGVPAPLVAPQSSGDPRVDAVERPRRPDRQGSRRSTASRMMSAVFSLPDDAGGLPGTTAVVPIDLMAADGTLSVDLWLTFDPTVLDPTSVTPTPFAGGFQTVANLATPGQIRLAMFGTPALTGDGTLAEITFDVIGSPQSETDLEITYAFINEGLLASSNVNGHFCADGAISEVRDVKVGRQAAGSSVMNLSWVGQNFADSYNVYRGAQRDASDMACLLPGLVSPNTPDDGAVPASGSVLYYLVSAVNCRGETTLGMLRPDPLAFCP